jgi:hypothetical protein
MEILEKNAFIQSLTRRHSSRDSLQAFIKHALIRSGQKTIPLADAIASQRVSLQDVALLHKWVVKNKNDYLSRFYETSLEPFTSPMPKPVAVYNNHHHRKFKNIIRNLHYKAILEDTTSGLENTPSFLHVITNLFKHWIIDYKLITPSALGMMSRNQFGAMLSAFYFRASIMNPYLVYSLHHNEFETAARIFTPTLGWSSYAYGFLEAPRVTEYVGTDVIPEVCDKTDALIRDRYPDKQGRIFCCPSEDLWKVKGFKDRYAAYFDLVFFSPPYFQLEMYKGGQQSTDRYTTYEEWLNGYWKKTIELCSRVLKQSSRSRLCYILSDYGSGDHLIRLTEDMNAITLQWFDLVKTIPVGNTNVGVTKHRKYAEYIYVFTKKK